MNSMEQMLKDMGITYDPDRLALTEVRCDNEYMGPMRVSLEFVVFGTSHTQVYVPPVSAPWPPPAPVAQVTGKRARSEASPLNGD